jgi:hypothetical protein
MAAVTSLKDDNLVMQFMILFAKLRDWIDDDPNCLHDLAAKDESIKKLCLDTGNFALKLSLAERRRRPLFAAPVDPQFLKVWRDYEIRYSQAMANILLADLWDIEPGTFLRAQRDTFDDRWEVARCEAQESANAMDQVFDFVSDHIEVGDYPQSLADNMERGISTWRHLTVEAGLDVEGIMRRREIVPFVLIPRHVSRRHGDAEKLSLLTHLQQAQEAFVYGVSFASIALMRSLLEAVLKTHYGSTGQDLEQLVSNARSLPVGVKRVALHQLRRLANHIIHFGNADVEMPQDLERQLAKYLYTLRALIEGAPSTPRPA